MKSTFLILLIAVGSSDSSWGQKSNGMQPMVVKGASGRAAGFGTAAAGPLGPNGQPLTPGQMLDPNANPLLNQAANPQPAPKLQKNAGFGAPYPKMPGGEIFDSPAGFAGEYFGPGIIEECNQAPANVQTQFKVAMNFRGGCGVANLGDQQKIVVNDFTSRPSVMYIFNTAGQCLGKTMVAFGNGAGGAPVACAGDSSHLTPPGFHLTGVKFNGSDKYNSDNSMKMVALQGQASGAREILVHGTGAPGTSSTYGCAGVGREAYPKVRSLLGYGALVYNYFRPDQFAAGCRNSAGRSTSPNGCFVEPGQQVPGLMAGSTGSATH